MKFFIYPAKALLLLIASLAVLQTRALGQETPAGRARAENGSDKHRAMLTTYCVTCHNTRLKTGDLAFDSLGLQGRAG